MGAYAGDYGNVQHLFKKITVLVVTITILFAQTQAKHISYYRKYTQKRWPSTDLSIAFVFIFNKPVR